MADLNIELNTQIVLCPGWNDGAVLDETIADLSTLGEQPGASLLYRLV